VAHLCQVDGAAPPGTYGFADLARAAVEVTVGGSAVEVARLVDLLRIALTDPAPYSQRFVLAIDATLQGYTQVALARQQRCSV
jgi:hypothetical protein